MKAPLVLTIGQLNAYVKSLLDGDDNLNHVYVSAEISNFTNHYRTGHFYFSLKDENAVIRAVMFRSSAQRLKFLPQDGMRVIVRGRVSLYERDGQYQLYVDDLQPDGVGALNLAYEQLKEKLSKEGLFAPERKKNTSTLSHAGGSCHLAYGSGRPRYYQCALPAISACANYFTACSGARSRCTGADR